MVFDAVVLLLQTGVHPTFSSTSSGGLSGLSSFNMPSGGYSTPPSGYSTPPSGYSTPPSWVHNSTVETPMFEEVDDPCAICHDELLPMNCIRLECGHRFHDRVRVAHSILTWKRV